jgi:hypothetical protein
MEDFIQVVAMALAISLIAFNIELHYNKKETRK